jgi:hypothetical protein
MTKLYLVPKLIVDTETVETIPNFDIIMDDEDNWFKEALLHLDEESE